MQPVSQWRLGYNTADKHFCAHRAKCCDWLKGLLGHSIVAADCILQKNYGDTENQNKFMQIDIGASRDLKPQISWPGINHHTAI